MSGEVGAAPHGPPPTDSNTLRAHADRLSAARRRLIEIAHAADGDVNRLSATWKGQWKDDFVSQWYRFLSGDQAAYATAWQQRQQQAVSAGLPSYMMYEVTPQHDTAFQVVIQNLKDVADELYRAAHDIDQNNAAQMKLVVDGGIILLSVVATVLSFGVLAPEAGAIDLAALGGMAAVGGGIGLVSGVAIDFSNQMIDNAVGNDESWGTAWSQVNWGDVIKAGAEGFVQGAVFAVVSFGVVPILARVPAAGGLARGLGDALTNPWFKAGFMTGSVAAGGFVSDIAGQAVGGLFDHLPLGLPDFGHAGISALVSGGLAAAVELPLAGYAAAHPTYSISDASSGDVLAKGFVKGDGTLMVNGGSGDSPTVGRFFENGDGGLMFNPGNGQDPFSMEGKILDFWTPTGAVRFVNADGGWKPVSMGALSDGRIAFTPAEGQRLPDGLTVGPDGKVVLPRSWTVGFNLDDNTVRLTSPGNLRGAGTSWVLTTGEDGALSLAAGFGAGGGIPLKVVVDGNLVTLDVQAARLTTKPLGSLMVFDAETGRLQYMSFLSGDGSLKVFGPDGTFLGDGLLVSPDTSTPVPLESLGRDTTGGLDLYTGKEMVPLQGRLLQVVDAERAGIYRVTGIDTPILRAQALRDGGVVLTTPEGELPLPRGGVVDFLNDSQARVTYSGRSRDLEIAPDQVVRPLGDPYRLQPLAPSVPAGVAEDSVVEAANEQWVQDSSGPGWTLTRDGEPVETAGPAGPLTGAAEPPEPEAVTLNGLRTTALAGVGPAAPFAPAVEPPGPEAVTSNGLRMAPLAGGLPPLARQAPQPATAAGTLATGRPQTSSPVAPLEVSIPAAPATRGPVLSAASTGAVPPPTANATAMAPHHRETAAVPSAGGSSVSPPARPGEPVQPASPSQAPLVAGARMTSTPESPDGGEESLQQLTDRVVSEILGKEAHGWAGLQGEAAAIEQKLAAGQQVEPQQLAAYLEYRGYAEAARWVIEQALAPGEWAPDGLIAVSEIRHIHVLAMRPVWAVAPHPEASDMERPGNFRQHNIMPFVEGMTPPDFTEVPFHVRDWVDQVNRISSSDDRSLEAVARAHAAFERIHPFIEGNGRTGRLALNLILMRLGHPPVVVPESDRDAYLGGLRAADAGNPAPLADLLARWIGTGSGAALPWDPSQQRLTVAGRPWSPETEDPRSGFFPADPSVEINPSGDARVVWKPEAGRFDHARDTFDRALAAAMKYAGDLGESPVVMYDPEMGTLIGMTSADAPRQVLPEGTEVVTTQGSRGWRIDGDRVDWWVEDAGGYRYGSEWLPVEQAGPRSERGGAAHWQTTESEEDQASTVAPRPGPEQPAEPTQLEESQAPDQPLPVAAGGGRGSGGGRLFTEADLADFPSQITPIGPRVRIPARESGDPAMGLEIAAGPVNTDVGMPPRPDQPDLSVVDPLLVDLTRTDIAGRPGVVVLDATQPIPPALRDQDFVILNNPHGFQVDIDIIGEAVHPGGRIIVQGRAEVVPGMRPANPEMTRLLNAARAGTLPAGYRVVEILTDPTVPGGARGGPGATEKPSWVLGGNSGGFHQTTGGPVSWPNTRIIIERLPEGVPAPPVPPEVHPGAPVEPAGRPAAVEAGPEDPPPAAPDTAPARKAESPESLRERQKGVRDRVLSLLTRKEAMTPPEERAQEHEWDLGWLDLLHEWQQLQWEGAWGGSLTSKAPEADETAARQRALESLARMGRSPRAEEVAIPAETVWPPRVDANGNPIPWGDGGLLVRFDVVRLPAGATGPATTQIVLPISWLPDAGVSAADIARVERETLQSIDHWFNLGHQELPDGSVLEVKAQFTVAGDLRLYNEVRLRAGAGRAEAAAWYVDGPWWTRGHEAGHWLGLADEYPDSQVPGREAPASPGVHRDGSLMGEPVGIPMSVMGRHYSQIAALSAENGRRLPETELTEGLVRYRRGREADGQHLPRADFALRELLEISGRLLSGEPQGTADQVAWTRARVEQMANIVRIWLDRGDPAPEADVVAARQRLDDATSALQRLRELEVRLREVDLDWQLLQWGEWQSRAGRYAASVQSGAQRVSRATAAVSQAIEDGQPPAVIEALTHDLDALTATLDESFLAAARVAEGIRTATKAVTGQVHALAGLGRPPEKLDQPLRTRTAQVLADQGSSRAVQLDELVERLDNVLTSGGELVRKLGVPPTAASARPDLLRSASGASARPLERPFAPMQPQVPASSDGEGPLEAAGGGAREQLRASVEAELKAWMLAADGLLEPGESGMPRVVEAGERLGVALRELQAAGDALLADAEGAAERYPEAEQAVEAALRDAERSVDVAAWVAGRLRAAVDEARRLPEDERPGELASAEGRLIWDVVRDLRDELEHARGALEEQRLLLEMWGEPPAPPRQQPPEASGEAPVPSVREPEAVPPAPAGGGAEPAAGALPAAGQELWDARGRLLKEAKWAAEPAAVEAVRQAEELERRLGVEIGERLAGVVTEIDGLVRAPSGGKSPVGGAVEELRDARGALMRALAEYEQAVIDGRPVEGARQAAAGALGRLERAIEGLEGEARKLAEADGRLIGLIGEAGRLPSRYRPAALKEALQTRSDEVLLVVGDGLGKARGELEHGTRTVRWLASGMLPAAALGPLVLEAVRDGNADRWGLSVARWGRRLTTLPREGHDLPLSVRWLIRALGGDPDIARSYLQGWWAAAERLGPLSGPVQRLLTIPLRFRLGVPGGAYSIARKGFGVVRYATPQGDVVWGLGTWKRSTLWYQGPTNTMRPAVGTPLPPFGPIADHLPHVIQLPGGWHGVLLPPSLGAVAFLLTGEAITTTQEGATLLFGLRTSPGGPLLRNRFIGRRSAWDAAPVQQRTGLTNPGVGVGLTLIQYGLMTPNGVPTPLVLTAGVEAWLDHNLYHGASPDDVRGNLEVLLDRQKWVESAQAISGDVAFGLQFDVTWPLKVAAVGLLPEAYLLLNQVPGGPLLLGALGRAADWLKILWEYDPALMLTVGPESKTIRDGRPVSASAQPGGQPVAPATSLEQATG